MKLKEKLTEDEKNSQDNNLQLLHSENLIKNNANSIRAVALIRAYRQRGHLLANLIHWE